MRADTDHLQFLTYPDASVTASVSECINDGCELLLRGTRGGVLSLSNILLWLHANNWRRELLSLTDLPFFEAEELEILIRCTDAVGPENYGTLRYDKTESNIEWSISDLALERAGLTLHRLACMPEHEYDYFQLSPASDLNLRVRMSDASAWL